MKGKEIFNHFIVPKHEIMSKKEVELTKKIYNIELDKFPKIYTSDPTVKAIDAKAGDLIKITRPSPTSGTTIYYRVVTVKQDSALIKPDSEETIKKTKATAIKSSDDNATKNQESNEDQKSQNTLDSEESDEE
ncbi:MAG: DNA-directed RNA polymerase subunit H [Thermodesulfovibrionia bacterium]|nr:DNA-directed RNA polymerase subunit H [Thermodesulfovibrionia bacterium]